MKKKNFDYQGAIDEGYTPDEVHAYLQEKHPKFDVQGALKEGYEPQEIIEHLYNPPKSNAEKGTRLARQTALGATEAYTWPIDIALAPQGSPGQYFAAQIEDIGGDIEDIYERQYLGRERPGDKEKLAQLEAKIHPDNLKKLAEFSEKSAEEIGGFSTQRLLEEATGMDLHPEGVLEKGARFIGFFKDPKKGWNALKEIYHDPKKLLGAVKEIIPGTKSLRALGAGAGLEMAEQGNFGPVGSIAAAVIGDIIGHGPEALKYVATHPKQVIAEGINLFTRGNSKKTWIEQIVKDANEAGIQLDAGTLTDSNLIRMAQARASQSALSGNALDNFRKDLSNQIIDAYKKVGDTVGENIFENNFQAAEAIKTALKVEEQSIPAFKDFDKPARSLEGRVSVEERPLYQQELLQRIAPEEFPNDYVAGETLKTAAQDIKTPIQEEFNQRWSNFGEQTREIQGPQAQLARELEEFVQDNQGSLLLGESTAEARVLTAAEDLLGALRTETGELIGVSLENLIKTKRTLGDVANFEVGTSDFSSRFKHLVARIDHAIDQTLERIAPELREQFEQLNAEYSHFKDVFENKNVQKLFEPKNENYNSIYNSFVNDADKLRSLEDMFYTSERGEQLINQVKRDYAQRVTSNPNFNARDYGNLRQTLGPEFEPFLEEFMQQRNYDIEHPRPRARQQRPLGINVQAPQTKPSVGVVGRKYKEADVAIRKKMYEYLKGKSADQIMKKFDTVEGIREMKRVLSLTPEGKKLFQDLARFKLEEMIGRKMTSDMKENVKLGTFSNLLKTSKNKAIVKELIGTEAYDRLRLLQKNASHLEESLGKFYNTSKSGTTVGDMGLVSGVVLGAATGNPFLLLNSLGLAAGIRISAYLLADPEFLKLLEKAVLTNNKEKFIKLLEQMRPSVEQAAKATGVNIKNKEEKLQ